MSGAEDFQVSDMAVSRANRVADLAADEHDDPALKIANLIGNGVNSYDKIIVTAEYAEFVGIDPTDFTLGVVTCAKMLTEAGMTITPELLEALKERVRSNELGVSRYLEAAHQGEDLRRFYLEEDGGNG